MPNNFWIDLRWNFTKTMIILREQAQIQTCNISHEGEFYVLVVPERIKFDAKRAKKREPVVTVSLRNI